MTIAVYYLICLYTLVRYVVNNKDPDNNMDPDQTAPEGTVWSGSILFPSWVKVFWKAYTIWMYADD